MTDRVDPTATKPTTTSAAADGGGATTGAAAGANPAKPKAYNPSRIPYRPTPPTSDRRRWRRRCHCRRCVCLSCFWIVLIFLLLILLSAVVGGAFYVLYRPQRPEFSIAAVKLTKFNLSTAASDGATRLSAALNLTLSAKNPDKRMIYAYDPISISAYSGQTVLANGSFPGFVSYPNDITIIHSTLSMQTQVLDSGSVSGLKSDLIRKNGLPIKILMDTMVLVRLEKMKSKKVGIRVTCEGVKVSIPKGKSPGLGTTSNAQCTVDLRITLWKWTF